VARRCHSAGRCPFDIKPKDIDLARLYSYAFRAHVIGAFHATRLAVDGLGANERSSTAGPLAYLQTALSDLADLAMDPIQPDMRALLSTFHHYDQGVRRAIDGLEQLLEIAGDGRLDRIARRFRAAVEAISNSGGIVVTRDTAVPEQASFVVPNLGITIVPLVYGDFHSWNLAWLSGPKSDVPVHWHREGVEIHLGFGPMHGETILGKCRAEVGEAGYAMPIPPLTAHGYVNRSDHEHHVPFVYGSLKAGGWGVFLDVDPQPCAVERLKKVDLKNRAMNGSLELEPAIAQAAALGSSKRRVLIPPKATDRNGCGGLELGVARVTPRGLRLPVDSFRAVSVVRGQGLVDIAGVEQPIQAHDHFGIPAGMTVELWQKGREPLVILDALIRSASG
jgi:hypothetical protein